MTKYKYNSYLIELRLRDEIAEKYGREALMKGYFDHIFMGTNIKTPEEAIENKEEAMSIIAKYFVLPRQIFSNYKIEQTYNILNVFPGSLIPWR